MPDPVLTVAEYKAAQVAEYTTYVAVQAIDINGARAFNVGDPVPASHVDRGVVDSGQVSKVTTKAGREAAGITADSPSKG
jgi:hypothetical protein